MKSAKTFIAILLAMVLAVAIAIPVFAATANTNVTVSSGGSATTPLVKAMWESTGAIGSTVYPTQESGDTNHVFFPDNTLTQVAPIPGFQATTPVTFWAVVTDSTQSLSNISAVYADVYYPSSGADPGPNNSLKFEVQLTKIDPSAAVTGGQALIDVNAAYADHMVTINTNTPTFVYPANTSATQIGDIDEELIQGTAAIYYGTFNFDNCELAGIYPVYINEINGQNVHATLTNNLNWVAATGAAFDFTQVNYGTVVVGGNTQINGDYTWNTSLTGANPATIMNTGNTYLQLTVSQDDMGFGTTSANGVTSYNVSYDARLGAGTDTTYAPFTTVTLPQVLKLCALDKIDFSILVAKDPSMTANHTYNGTMTLGVVGSTTATSALEGQVYGMSGNPAITPSPYPTTSP
jgi:hypothetical protein